MKTLFLFYPLFAFYQYTSKPNIIIILTDQQSANAMSCAGNESLHTPAMDRLAADGVHFTRAFCTFPVCTPARASIITGLMPHQAGVIFNEDKFSDEIRLNGLGFVMQNNGYEAVYGGKWHLPTYPIGNNHGFRRIAGFNDYQLADSCVNFIQKKHSKPFFMMVSFDNPHNICEYARNQSLPWGDIPVPADIKEYPNLPDNFAIPAYEPDIIRNYQQQRPFVFPVWSYTPDDWRRYRYVYFKLVEKVDAEIGKILNALDKAGLYENSVIIFSSDHGDGQGAHQWNQKEILYNEIINVPLIIKLPKNASAGTTIDTPVSAGLDIYPTVCEFAGIKAPTALEGFSLLNSISNPRWVRDPVFIQTVFRQNDTRVMTRDYYGYAVIKGKYKYVNYVQGKYKEQLFNIETDPGEMVNLAVESKYNEVVSEYKKLLFDWMTEKNAPGLRRYIK